MIKDKVIIINGSNAAGKDTFVNTVFNLVKQDKSKHLIMTHNSSISGIKKMLQDNSIWDGVKDERGRKLLCDVKIAIDRYNSDLITTQLFNDIKKQTLLARHAEMNILTFVDIREPINIRRLRLMLHDCTYIDTHTLLIRSGQQTVADNQADLNVNDFIYDYAYMIPHGDDDVLKESARHFLYQIYNP